MFSCEIFSYPYFILDISNVLLTNHFIFHFPFSIFHLGRSPLSSFDPQFEFDRSKHRGGWAMKKREQLVMQGRTWWLWTKEDLTNSSETETDTDNSSCTPNSTQPTSPIHSLELKREEDIVGHYRVPAKYFSAILVIILSLLVLNCCDLCYCFQPKKQCYAATTDSTPSLTSQIAHFVFEDLLHDLKVLQEEETQWI